VLILITTRKSLPLVPDKVRPHFRQVLINIRQVSNIIPIQQLVVDFHRYIQRVRDVPHQHPTQASRNPRSNPELTREGRELPQLMTYCIDFARLVIRGCGQPLYKRFHHNKMVYELKKNNMLNEKVNY
jgi:succinate dehydrogenase/fumarate reductase-like Fe-S protein